MRSADGKVLRTKIERHLEEEILGKTHDLTGAGERNIKITLGAGIFSLLSSRHGGWGSFGVRGSPRTDTVALSSLVLLLVHQGRPGHAVTTHQPDGDECHPHEGADGGHGTVGGTGEAHDGGVVEHGEERAGHQRDGGLQAGQHGEDGADLGGISNLGEKKQLLS